MKKLFKALLIFILFGMAGCESKPVAVLPEALPELSGSTVLTPMATSVLTATPTQANTKAPSPTNTKAPTPTWTPIPTPTNTPTPVPSVDIVMVGDILLHDRLHKYSIQEDGSYNYDTIFEHTSEISRAADIAIVNQEVIIGGIELGVSGYPNFNAPQEIGHALVSAGYDVILHATNHALDKKKQGLLNCLNFWNTAYPEIAVLGINGSKEAQDEILVMEQEGIRIAILNYTYGTNGISMPEDMPYAVTMLEEEKVIRDLEQADSLADFVIVCPHWGTEYQLEADKSQKKWTKIFLEHGADLVIGTHPHVIEPVEWVTNETTGESMLVYYSIGNFVNWTASKGQKVARRMVGGIADITIQMDENGKAYIADYGIIPIVSHVEKRTNGITVYLLEEYTNELAQKNDIRLQDPDFTLQYCIDLCDKVWGDLWR